MVVKYTEKERDQALEIIKMFSTWNTGQKSISHAFGGQKTEEDAIYDERRKLIKKAYEVLNAS
jgi:hypothetical protein